MLPTLWRWQSLLWVRSLTRGEARRPLFKLCLLAWLCSLPAAWTLIGQKASAPLPPFDVRWGLLRWSALWMATAQALLAALLWLKHRRQIRDAFLLTHPSSWKKLLIYRLAFSVTAASLLFTLSLFAAFRAGLLTGPSRPSLWSLLLFALCCTLQAFTLAVAAACAMGCTPAGRKAGLLARAGLTAFFASIFFLTWGGDWLLQHHAPALRLLGSPLADWGRWAWMPLQALQAWRGSDWTSLSEAVLVLSGTSFLSIVFLARPAESAGRLLWPQAGPARPSRSFGAGWWGGARRACRLNFAALVRLFAFKDLMVPLLRSRTKGLSGLLVPPLLAVMAPTALSAWLGQPGEVWISASVVLLAAWPARRGLKVWGRERPMEDLLKPWLPPRLLFLAKFSAFLLWNFLQALLSLLVVALAAWLAKSAMMLPPHRLLFSAVLLAAVSFLIGWVCKDNVGGEDDLSWPANAALAGRLLYWALVSALLLPPPWALSLSVLALAVSLAAAMAWMRLLKAEGGRI